MSKTNSTATGAILRTTVVGSYPQPDWLIDRNKLAELMTRKFREAKDAKDDEAKKKVHDEALLEGVTQHMVTRRLLEQVPVPR